MPSGKSGAGHSPSPPHGDAPAASVIDYLSCCPEIRPPAEYLSRTTAPRDTCPINMAVTVFLACILCTYSVHPCTLFLVSKENRK